MTSYRVDALPANNMSICLRHGRIYHWDNCPPPLFELRKISHMAKNATLEKLSQWKITIVATRCQILEPKCTKFDFGWGSTPDQLGELTALPDHLTEFKGSYLYGRGGKEGKEGERGRGDGREGIGTGREGKKGRGGMEALFKFPNTPVACDHHPRRRQTSSEKERFRYNRQLHENSTSNMATSTPNYVVSYRLS